MIRSTIPAPAPRRGVILLVVIALLTLFAVVGITFVMYSQQRADAARATRESQQQILGQVPNDTPQTLIQQFAASFVFGQPDQVTPPAPPQSAPGLKSAMRGHELARGIYGYNPLDTDLNQIPYNGTGRLRGRITPFKDPNQPPNTLYDEYGFVNYTYFAADIDPATNQPMLHDPERWGWRTINTSPVQNPYLGGFNAPYTYPDLNTMCLAVLGTDQQGNTVVIQPSFHRDWAGFGPFYVNVQTQPNQPPIMNPNPNWYDPNPALKYMVLRPRPADHAGFPPPTDQYGDVRNLPGSGRNDSFWMDLGSPVQTLSDGRKYKAMFAPLIVDLDGRVNLNVAGNIRGITPQGSNPVTGVSYSHVSNQGWGPWEIDVSQVLPLNPPQPTSPSPEWTKLFTGGTNLQGSQQVPVRGRYGSQVPYQPAPNLPPIGITYPTAYPTNSPLIPPSPGVQPSPLMSMPRFYAQVDYDGSNETGMPPGPPFTALSGQFTLPPQAAPGNTPTLFPIYANAGYGNNSLSGSAPLNEFNGHPHLFNPFQPAGDPNQLGFNLQPGAQDRIFDVATNLAPLLMLPDNAQAVDVTGSSDLGKLSPTNFANPLYRRLVTTLSYDVDRPGLSPWFWPMPNSTPLLLPYDPANPSAWVTNPTILTPQGNAIAFPPIPGQPGGEFGSDLRAVEGLLGLGRIDLNRTLRKYPSDPTTGLPVFVNDPTAPGPNNTPSFNEAQADRQQLAADIFVRLVKVTGAYDLTTLQTATDPNLPQPQRQQAFDALRWLAQLSVNIVDYIDADDYMTPFNWTAVGSQAFQTDFTTNVATLDPSGKGWVLGTEQPRLVINEAYSEIRNGTPATGPFNVDFWVELLNTFQDNSGANQQPNTFPDPGTATLWANNATIGVPGTEAYPIYQLVIARRTDDTATVNNSLFLRKPNNVFGDLDPGTPAFPNQTAAPPILYLTVSDYTSTVTTPAPSLTIPAGGYCLLGPSDQVPNGSVGFPNPTFATTTNPSNYSYTNNMVTPPEIVPSATTTYSSGMSYQVTNSTATSAAVISAATGNDNIVLLRRLACPYMRPQPNPAKPGYNPYITVDYLDNDTVANPQATPKLTTFDNVTSTSPAGPRTPTPATWDQRIAIGRTQPFAALFQVPQTPVPPAAPLANQPQNTFMAKNRVLKNANAQDDMFDWLVHLDRELISPMELLQVSAFRPHELTRMFMRGSYVPQAGNNPPYWSTTPAQQFAHRAQWTDQDLPAPAGNPTPLSHRLARLFEFVETKNRMAGMSVGGRIPGKININTVWDLATFQALCAALPKNSNPPGPNNFDQSDVAQIFTQLIAQRTQSPPTQAIDQATGQLITTMSGAPTANDRPFFSIAAGLSAPSPQDALNPLGLSIENTLLRSLNLAQGGQRLLELTPIPNNATDPRNHPYIRDQLLTKVYNNLTTRSNVFAVWITVGFFAVVDPNAQPPKLGAELGLDLGQNVRHHLFAIIDRSALTMPVRFINSVPPNSPWLGNAYPPTCGNTIAAGNNRSFTVPIGYGMPNPPPYSAANPPPAIYPIPAGSSVVVQCTDATGKAAIRPDPTATNPPPVVVRNPLMPWQAGSIVTVADGVDTNNMLINPETVVVKNITVSNVVRNVPNPNTQWLTATITVDFKKPHSAGFQVYTTLPGNPGPTSTFDPDTNSALVPFYMILD